MKPEDTGPPDKIKAAGSAGSAAAGKELTQTRDRNTTPPPARDTTTRRRDPRRGRIRYVRWWFADQASRTEHLSATALGAYLRLFGEYIRTQAPLPDDAVRLARITRISQRDWPRIRDELDYVFDTIDGLLVDEYAEKCIAEFRTASARNRRNRGHRFSVIDGDGERP